MRISCPFKLIGHTTVTSNCLSIQLVSASNQDLKIAFLYHPNDEKDKVSNLRKAFNYSADNGSTNKLTIGDYNTSLKTDLDYVGYSQEPHRASREFLRGLLDYGVFRDVYRFPYPYDLSYTWKVHNSQKCSRIDLAFAN